MSEYLRYFLPNQHLYQPPRSASHEALKDIPTDPLGIDWTERAALECYLQLLRLGVLKESSFDAYATLRHDLERIGSKQLHLYLEKLKRTGVIDPALQAVLMNISQNSNQDQLQVVKYHVATLSDNESQSLVSIENVLRTLSFQDWETLGYESINPAISKELKEQLASHGIGDSFIHVILPHLDRRDKDLIIAAGKYQFEQDSGAIPEWFWAPESALDTDTLESLATAGYKGVLCAPHQVRRFDNQMADNRPTRVNLPSGKQIILLAFDKPVSQSFAFHDKSNADRFAHQHILSAASRVSANGVLTMMTDGETFGHHAKGGDKFLEYLLKVSLPREGVEIVSISDVIAHWQRWGYDATRSDAEGSLVENTAWSCMCGDLRRWKGGCSCTGGGEWKAAYYQLFAHFNEVVRTIVDQYLGDHDQELVTRFKEALYNQGSEYSDPDLSLLSARASALAARTSCATFFGDPHTSGRINILYASQALRHLEDAGLRSEAEHLREYLHRALSQIPDPTQPGKSLFDTMQQLLEEREVAYY
jgi:hypothetical protein